MEMNWVLFVGVVGAVGLGSMDWIGMDEGGKAYELRSPSLRG